MAFERHKLFAASAVNPIVYKEGWAFTVSFKLPSDLYVSNDHRQPTLIEINFGDGNGFQQVDFDISKSISYDFSQFSDSAGGCSWPVEYDPHPMVDKDLIIRIHYGSEILESVMPLTIVPCVCPTDDIVQFSNLPMLCDVTAPGHNPNDGRGYIVYGNPENEIRKPVILIEGFDSGLEDYGLLTWETMSTGRFFDGAGNPIYEHLAQMPDLFEDMKNAGYDLILVDFKDGKDYIQNNGLAVVKLIQWVNSELEANGSDEELVVMGASMGGLIARWALRQVEIQGCCHNTRLYGTFDTPHRGANIPLGVQHFVKESRDALGWYVKSAQLSYDAVLSSPGASQMSRYHIDPVSSALHSSWIAEIDSLGHPNECYKIAIINGSIEAVDFPITTPSKIMVEVDQWAPVPKTFVPGTSWLEVLVLPIPAPMNLLRANCYAEANGTIFEYSNYWGNTNAAVLALIIAAMAYAINLLAKFLSLIPAWTWVCLAIIVFSKIAANTALPPLHTINLISTLISNSHNAPAGIINYTEAPGSMTDFPKTVERSTFGIATTTWPNHTFVASVSGLDIDTNDLYFNIKNALVSNSSITPFDAYYANKKGPEETSINQSHVEFTAENRSWVIQQFKKNRNLRRAFQDSSLHMPLAKRLQTDYNFGDPARKFLSSLNIEQGAVLAVNELGAIGFSTGIQNTSVNSSFDLFTVNPNCDSVRIVIEDGGIFNIGDDNYTPITGGQENNRAQVYFRDQSVLEILPGGRLNILDNSRLLIEEGGEIIIHPGAIIELDGTKAILELQGHLTLKDGTILQTLGNGFIRFNQNVAGLGNWANYQHYGAGCEIHFVGSGQNLKRAEVLSSTVLNKHLDSLVFDNARVELAPDVFFGLQSRMSIKNSHFTSLDQNDMAAGVRTYGQVNLEIENSRFSYMKTGLLANSLVLTHPINVGNSEFDHCDFGLRVIGKNFTSTGNRFHLNETGLYGDNIDGTSKIINTDFDEQINYGFRVVGQNGSIVKMSGSSLDDNQTGGLVQGTYFHAWCNDFIDNDVAINSDGSNLMLGKPQGHDNNFVNNRIDMMFYELDQLKLANGLNNFSGWYRYIIGSFSNNASNYLYYNGSTSGYELDVKDNSMPVVGASTVPVSLDINSQTVGLRNWGPQNLLSTACIAVVGQAAIQGITDCCNKTSFNVNTQEFNNMPLDSAIKISIGDFDDGETTTLDNLKEIQEFINNDDYCYLGSSCVGENFSELDVLILRDLFSYYLSSLSKAYENGHIELNRADPEGELSNYLNFIIQESDYRLANEAPNASAPEEIAFYYNLSKAHAYRMGEHYEEALAILQNTALWNSAEEILQANYWECACEAERDLILENVSPEEFLQEMTNCQNQTNSKRSPRSFPTNEGVDVSNILKELKDQVDLAPNPSNGNPSLVFSAPSDAGEYNIYSIEGKIVASGVIEQNAREVKLNHQLSSGYYTVKIERSGLQSKTLKWIVK